MKKAEEILDDTLWFEPSIAKEKILEAMREYASQAIDEIPERMWKPKGSEKDCSAEVLRENIKAHCNYLKSELK